MSTLPQIRTQLIGAAAGTVIALGLYGAYTVAAPFIASLLPQTTAEASVSKFTDADRQSHQDEIVARARELLLEKTNTQEE